MIRIYNSSQSEDLILALQRTDISVPARTEGRQTADVETWIICRLLSTLANENALRFPLSVIHRDRPDFLIDTADELIGVEATEAVSEQYAAYSALAEREFPEALLEPDHFRWGAPKLTLSDMRELLSQTELTGDGWAGDRPEREWALWIQSIVNVKLKKLAQPQFDKFDKNWLAIYDNLPVPTWNLAEAIGFLLPLIDSCWSQTPRFDALFVEHGPVIAQITQAGSVHFVLNDLWD